VSKVEKLIRKLISRNKNFTYSELKSLLSSFGYEEQQKGKTSGSRVAFINKINKNIIRLHKPHPGDELKLYQIDLIIKELSDQGFIK
jgi:hypothetical protein